MSFDNLLKEPVHWRHWSQFTTNLNPLRRLITLSLTFLQLNDERLAGTQRG